jgi:hypothetical protein
VFAGKTGKVFVRVGVVFADFLDDVLADVGVVFFDLLGAADQGLDGEMVGEGGLTP